MPLVKNPNEAKQVQIESGNVRRMSDYAERTGRFSHLKDGINTAVSDSLDRWEKGEEPDWRDMSDVPVRKIVVWTVLISVPFTVVFILVLITLVGGGI